MYSYSGYHSFTLIWNHRGFFYQVDLSKQITRDLNPKLKKRIGRHRNQPVVVYEWL